MPKEKLLNISAGKGDTPIITPLEFDKKQTIYCEHDRFKDRCPICSWVKKDAPKNNLELKQRYLQDNGRVLRGRDL